MSKGLLLLGTRGDDRGTIRLLKLPEGTLIEEHSGHTEEISGLVMDDDHRILVTSCRGGDVRFWKWNKGTKRLEHSATVGPFSGAVKRLALSGDGQTLMVLVEDESAARILRLDLVGQEFENLGLRW